MGNWKIQNGDFYVSKSGSLERGVTGTAEAPFRTLRQAVNAAYEIRKAPVIIVVGAGAYSEDIQLPGTKRLIFEADGRVVLDGRQSGGALFNASGGVVRLDLNGFHIEGTAALMAGGSTRLSLSNCVVKSAAIEYSYKDSSFTHCIFQHAYLHASPHSIGFANVVKCSFINSVLGRTSGSGEAYGALVDCFFDEASRIENVDAERMGVFDYNNLRFGDGRRRGFSIEVGGREYTSLDDLRRDFPNWNRHSINTDPRFNLAALEDMTLSANSPMAWAGSDGKHIGAWETAQAFGLANGPLEPGNVTLRGVEYGSGAYRLQRGVSVGSIETREIDMGSAKALGKIRLFATQSHPGDVVDYSNRPGNLNRQTFQMRFGNDSGRLGDWMEFEWDEVPTYNVVAAGRRTGVGNGDEAFDPEQSVPVVARYIQMIITLRNNGLAG